MAHVSMRLKEAVRDADPVVVTTASNERGGGGKIDGLPETKASSLLLPDLVGVLPICSKIPNPGQYAFGIGKFHISTVVLKFSNEFL